MTLAVILTLVTVGDPAGSPAWGEVKWLPGGTVFSRGLADPHEPRTSLSFGRHPNRFDATIGSPLPVVTFDLLGSEVTAVLEAATFFRMGLVGGVHFPLPTFDGLAGMGFETQRGATLLRLRLMHLSAHKGDGDATVTFPGQLFTREYWRLEAGRRFGRSFLRAGLGATWNSVPRDEGLHLLLGGQWTGSGQSWRPVAAAHWDSDAERSWRVNQNYLLGIETGDRRVFRLGVRYHHGNSFYGQYWFDREDYWSLYMQITGPGG